MVVGTVFAINWLMPAGGVTVNDIITGEPAPTPGWGSRSQSSPASPPASPSA